MMTFTRRVRQYLIFLVCALLIEVSATGFRGVLASVAFDRGVTALSNTRVQQRKRNTREQTKFSAEDAIQRPVDVPIDILKLLRNDERNQTCLIKGQLKEDMPASWFVASEIRLSNGRSSDLIVTATNPCLNGANVVPFWVFRKVSDRHTLVLSTTAFALEILNTRSKNYRNMRLTSLTATMEHTTIYKFDGNKYREWQRFQKTIG